MATIQNTQKLRKAILESIVDYSEKICQAKARQHYINRRWHLLIFPGYFIYILASSLLLYIGFVLYKVPGSDFTVMDWVFSSHLSYIITAFLISRLMFRDSYKARPLDEEPFYLRAYFLSNAIEYAYLRCFNRLIMFRGFNNLKASAEERKLICRAAKAPFWPTDIRKPWELRMPKPTLWQRIKETFCSLVTTCCDLPRRWSEKEVLQNYRRLSSQDKIYLMYSLRHVMYIFNSNYFEVPRQHILYINTEDLTGKTHLDKELWKVYGPFGKGVLSISDYFSLFPSVDHAYAAFYYVLRRTWKKLRLQDIRDGHRDRKSVV